MVDFEKTALPEVLIIKPRKFGDDRGYFLETFRANTYGAVGIELPFVQDNCSRSSKGVLRGLHFQWPRPQAKLISVASGSIYDVAVDIRRESPNFGKWIGVELSSQNAWQLYVPEGFAHGFCVLEDNTVITYKCSDYYSPETEKSLIWNDPAIGIDWPIVNPQVSSKDAAGRLLKDFSPSDLPPYKK